MTQTQKPSAYKPDPDFAKALREGLLREFEISQDNSGVVLDHKGPIPHEEIVVALIDAVSDRASQMGSEAFSQDMARCLSHDDGKKPQGISVERHHLLRQVWSAAMIETAHIEVEARKKASPSSLVLDSPQV